MPASQGLLVYENAVTPPTPAVSYRAWYPKADGWYELDSAGNTYRHVHLDSDNASLTIAGGINVGSASGAVTSQVYTKGTNIGGVFERNTDDDSPRVALSIRRTRSSNTAPALGFGPVIAFEAAAFTAGVNPGLAQIRGIWEVNQTNDTTDRDGAMTFHTMVDAGLVERMRLTSGGSLLVGTTTVGSGLGVKIAADTLTIVDQIAHRNGASNSLAIIQGGGSSQGTLASPGATASGDILLAISTRGYQATTGAYTGGLAAIRFITSQAFTNVAQGTEILFYTVPNGSTTVTQAMKLDQAQGMTVVGAFGCNTKAAQAAFASGGAAPAGGTGATAGAYDTAAHRDALITLVNNIRTALVNNGIMS